MNEDNRPSPKSSSTESEQITDPARIAPLLEQLAKRNAPLTIRVPGHKTVYTSCTVAVDKPYVLLDELMPTTGQKLLINEGALRVACKLDSVDIRFVVSLVRIDKQNNLVTNYMDLPTEIEYRQRRHYYRVHIPMSNQLGVMIDGVDDARNNSLVIEGLLHDLSLGGAGMLFPVSDINVDNGQLSECALELPEGQWLYCTLEFRYSKNTGSKNQQYIGARFVDLKPAQSRLIGRCISELEREFIKKRAAYE